MKRKINSVGRPRRDELSNIIKFTVDDKTAEAIRLLADEKSISQSEVMRKLTPIISSKNYETLIPVLAIEQLQKLSDQCWTYLHTPTACFPVDEISDVMPAFVTTLKTPMVYVKYPTFKIDVYNRLDSFSDEEPQELDKLLKDVKNRSGVYYTPVDYIIQDTEIAELDFRFISEVMCLSTDLMINQETKNSIVEILEKNGYSCSVYPAYCLRTAPIELIDDNKFFRLI